VCVKQVYSTYTDTSCG